MEESVEPTFVEPPAPNPRQQYAAYLAGILAKPVTHIAPAEYAEFGREVAKMQRPKRAIAYDDFTIAAWVNGTLLPTPQAQHALTECLMAEYNVPERILDKLEEYHHAAVDWQATQKHHPTELSNALKRAVADAGITQRALAERLDTRNRTRRSKDAHTAATGTSVHHLLNGYRETTPSKLFVYNIEQICRPGFSLRAIYENALRERADQLWATAAYEDDLGGLIQACRMRLGMSQETFSKHIGSLAGMADFGSAATTLKWEANQAFPCGNDTRQAQLYAPFVQAMKIADAAPNGLSNSIPSRWFDAKKEATFRNAYVHAARKMPDMVKFDIVIPSKKSVPLPDMRDIPATTRRYDGKLSQLVVDRENRPRS